MVERFPLNKNRDFNGTPSPVFVGENPKDCEFRLFAGNDITLLVFQRSFDSAQGLSERTK